MEFTIATMNCGGCASAVTNAIRSVDPEADIRIDLEAKSVRVASAASANAVSTVLAEAGFPAVPR